MRAAWFFAMCLVFEGLGCGADKIVPPDKGAVINDPVRAAADVRLLICSKLVSCFVGLGLDQCTTGVNAQTNLAEAIGLPSDYGTFKKVCDDEDHNLIRGNQNIDFVCQSEFQALSCTSAAVQTAYNAAAPDDFSHIVNMIPTGTSSCKGLF
jgi:hypothetical protein